MLQEAAYVLQLLWEGHPDDANVCAYCGTRIGSVLARNGCPAAADRRLPVRGFAEYLIRCHAVRLVWFFTASDGVDCWRIRSRGS
jgi:hypothetical protein